MTTRRHPFIYRSLFFTSLLFIFTHSSLNAATMMLNKDFELGNLSSLRCAGNCPAVTKSLTANGKYAGDFTLTRNMPIDYRTEITLGKIGHFEYGREYWLSFNYRLEDWKKDSSPEAAPFQIHTRSSDYTKECAINPAYSTAPFFMRTQNDEIQFITYPGKILWRAPLIKKKWINLTMHFRMSTDSDGFVEFWQDGVKLGRANGKTGPKFDKCGKPMKTPAFKMGVYKWDWKAFKNITTDSTRRQLLIDDLKMAEGSNGYSLVSSKPTVSSVNKPFIPSPEKISIPPIANNIEEDILVAHWSMEDGRGKTISDTSGNGYTGRLVNGAKLITGEGVKFDGVNDYLNVGNIDVVGNAMSLSAWFLADDLANCKARDCRIISKATGLGGQDHYFMVSTIKVGSETRLRFRLKTNGVTSTLIAKTGKLYKNKWIHVVAVYDGERMSLYKDGIEVGNRAKRGNINVNSGVPVWIGGNPKSGGSRPWAGHIDDVRIYNFPLTDNEIGVLADVTTLSIEEPSKPPVESGTEEGLAAYWSMNDGTGTLKNGAKLISGEGVKLDGVNDYLNVGNLSVAGNAISLSAWFLADDLANCKARDCRIISKATGLGEQDHYFMVSTIKVDSETRLRFRLKTNGITSTLIADTGNIYENEWVHVVAVYDGDMMTLYKDGIEVGNRAKRGNIAVNSSAPVWIGGNPKNSGSRPWAGHIDDVRIYDFSLTDNEIVELASATTLSIEEPFETSVISHIEAKQYYILKADDFSNTKKSPSKAVSEAYLRFIKLIKKKGIKAGLGIIAKDLENPTSGFISLIKKLNNSGRFEFWNHGYDHIYGKKNKQGNLLYAEFKNKPYDYQLLQMTKAQNIVKEKLGITMRSFGAPGNRSDATTARVIEDIGEIKVWMFNGAKPSHGILGLPKRTNMEWKSGNKRMPSFKRFKSQYNPNEKYLLSQLHPKWYSKKALNELEKIIDFLLSKGVEFILPYDYYQLSGSFSN